MIIISQRAQAARKIEFDSKFTVLTGDNPNGEVANRTGKSLVLKSLYFAFGAQLKKLTANWDNLDISTLVHFSFEDNNFVLYRNGNRFVLVNDRNEIKAFSSIDQLRRYQCDLFNFKIEYPVKENSENILAYPGAFFMPYYIDQDKGWSGDWNSFKDVFANKWKSEILLYHLGIRTPQYYQLLSEKTKLEIEQKDKKKQHELLTTLINRHINKYKDVLDVGISLESFAEEISDLMTELNQQVTKREELKKQIVAWLSELRELNELFDVAKKNRDELIKDADYVETDLTESAIICPLCGVAHLNNIENKFGLFNEIQICEETMENYFQKRDQIQGKISRKSSEIADINLNISNLELILNRKRETITFQEVVVSEGSKSVLRDMTEDRAQLLLAVEKNHQRLQEITNQQKQITKDGKSITDFYLSSLKNNLYLLDVIDINREELDTISLSFKSGGNDLPCAILAQVYAVANTAAKYSQTVLSPIVLDAIFQQEPAKNKMDKIWNFITEKQPLDTQLIISTTELHGKNVTGKVIRLLEEKELLKESEYNELRMEIDYYRNLSLQEDLFKS